VEARRRLRRIDFTLAKTVDLRGEIEDATPAMRRAGPARADRGEEVALD
jgi:hypothetical protein